MFSFFKAKPIVDEQTEQWLLDAFAWALEVGGVEAFKRSPLVLPDAHFFPDASQNPSQMASQTLARVLQYCQMSHWPISIHAGPPQLSWQPPTLAAAQRAQGVSLIPQSEAAQVTLNFISNQLKQPQAFIGQLALQVAAQLARWHNAPVPGGETARGMALEVLAHSFGFGVMLTNSAYTFRGGCGSCYDANALRAAQLDEAMSLYMLALIAQLKGWPLSNIKPQLKSYLRSDFKRAWQQVAQRLAINPALQLIAEHKEHCAAQA